LVAYVRFGSKADIETSPRVVRFTSDSTYTLLGLLAADKRITQPPDQSASDHHSVRVSYSPVSIPARLANSHWALA
jgi:hypothetical protein